MLVAQRRARRTWSWAAVAAALIGLVGSTIVASPAAAEVNAVFSLTKSVTDNDVTTGESFTYQITVNCSPFDCENATLVDTIPAQFDALTLNPTVAVTGGPSTYSWGGTNNRTLTVNFLTDLDGGGKGLAAGSGYQVNVSMSVPGGLSPDWPSNNVAVTNTVTAESPNAPTATASTDVTVRIPYVVNTTVGASWAPSWEQFSVGKESILTLSSRNTSNALAESLTILAPTDPTLTGNFFEGVNFAGFGTMTLPTGADQVQVDAWVNGAWVTGSPGATPALDNTVDPTQVTGLRLIFSSSTGATLAPLATSVAGSIQILLEQRSALRSPPNTSLISGTSLTAAVRGTVVVPGQTPVSKSTTATYEIGALTSVVNGSTSFTPGKIPAGTGSLVSVTGQNDSNGPLSSLTITEPAAGTLFSEDVIFDGFGAGSWPSGATGGSVEWFVSSGTAPADSSFTELSGLPATPTLTGDQRITGFAITYTGTIAQGATATPTFRVVVDAGILDGEASTYIYNPVTIDGHNDAGNAATVNRTATLQVVEPTVSVTLNKTVVPTAPIPAGGRSVVRLLTQTSTDTGYVSPTSITVDDLMTSDPLDYWRAFNAVAISSTDVPLGSTLTIRYTTNGTDWLLHTVVDATTEAKRYQGALPTPTQIVGLRFEFENSNGFAQGTAVRPAISFEARETLRGTTDPTATTGVDGNYMNYSTAKAIGTVTLDGDPLEVNAASGTETAVAIVKVVGAGTGGVMFDKSWEGVPVGGTLPSQSGSTVDALLEWGVEVSGYDSVVITDPADESVDVADTVFQAFDLLRIEPITVSDDPLIAYDKVTKVELYNGTAWVEVDACTPASNCTNGFDGYILDDTEIATTTGVRITFAENEDARTGDPLAPPIGSGVASGPDSRPISLVFELRNQVRDATGLDSPWITETTVLNNGAGALLNSAGITATGTPGTFTHEDTAGLLIDDSLPNLGLTKITGTGSTPTIAVPNPADVATGSYPTTSFTVTATNTSLARAWYLRVTDVMPCDAAIDCVHNTVGSDGGYDVAPYAGAIYDPATNPFQNFDIRAVSFTLSSNSGIDLSKSVVTRWLYNNGSPIATTQLSGSTLYANSAAMASSSTWTDVIGVSVLYAGTSTTDGGTIASGASAAMKIDVRLRQKIRTDSAVFVTPATITNTAFAQIWDNVLDDDNRWDTKSSSINLVEGTLNVTTGKSIRNSGGSTVTSILEKDRATDLTARLTGGSNNSTVSTKEVVIQDTGAAFWDNFGLRSLGTISTIPSGSNRVRVEVQLDGGTDWTASAAQTASNNMTPTLPTLPSGKTAANVTGIRYVFYRFDTTTNQVVVLSTSAPAAAWSTTINFTVRVRDALRSTGEPISFPVGGNTIAAPVSATSTNAPFPQAQANASTNITLNPGTFTADVEKRPAVATTPAGETVNFSLIVTNTGTGYLNNPVVVDTLPTGGVARYDGALLFDPTSEVTYSTSGGGVLPTTGMVTTYNDDARTITFTWPVGSRLAPGEKVTIVVPLQVAPGLTSGYGPVLNTMSLSSDRTLSACTNTSGNGRGVVFSAPSATCATNNVVTVVSATAISTFKGVKGNVDSSGVSTSGATNVNNSATACVSDSGGFYRNPCAANSVIGGTDLWKLQFTNGGNIASDSALIVDVLPKSGDVYLTTGASRGSAFAPVFNGNLTLITDDLSTGTTFTWQVSTASNPCPAFSGGSADPDCSSTAGWVDGESYAGTAGSIKAIRILFDFSALAGGTLPPASTLAVTYETVNTPSTTSGDGRAPVTVPVSTPRAWNSFGVHATFGAGEATRSVEPIRAGVQLATGPLEVTKVIAGSMDAYAPTSVQVSVACTVDGSPVVMGSAATLTLAATNAVPYSSRIDGIPVGSICTVTETTTGATSVSYTTSAGTASTPAVVTIGAAAASSAPVPTDQQVTVTNTYETTSLLVTKDVTTTTTVGSFGPFDFTLACTVNNGTTTLTFPLSGGDAAFSLSSDDPDTLADESEHLVTGLPVTAVCQLREADSDSATAISVVVNGGSATSVGENGAVSIPLGTAAQYTADVTNHFAGGQLSVTKTVAGTGFDFGTGPFAVDVVCAYEGETLHTETLSLVHNETELLTPVFPVGTECSLTETDAGGATTPASDQTVTIVGPTGPQVVGLTAAGLTNTFTTGTLEVTKDVTFTGPARAGVGVGPFEAQVVCTWVKSVGTTPLTIPLPDSGFVTLEAPDYTATVTGLIAGASCTVTETAGAGATTVTVGALSPATIPAGGQSTVEITNDFASGTLDIVKAWAGTEDSQSRFGEGPFTVEVECEYFSDDHWVALDLGDDATQVLDADNDYRATITGILADSVCTVVETDRGLATSSSLAPNNGVVTIVPSGSDDPQAAVTVTNTFETGKLEIVKLASQSLVQGADVFDYTLDVSNEGTVAAAGVTVVDEIPAALKVTAISAPQWSTCAVADADIDGYGGTLTCVYDSVLGAGSQAERITVTVEVLTTIEQDTIDNEATVTSTTRIVDGDDDDESVDVKWLDVNALAECVKDAPWLNYTVDAHNLDVGGTTMTVTWADSAGTVIHTDTVPIAGDGTITGRLLWPGAAVNADDRGIAWPGWRLALPGETPDWENLVLDTTLPEYGLRSDAQVTLAINPETTVTMQYPPATADCADTPDDRDPDLWFTKKASVAGIGAGATFDYVMTMGNTGLGAVEEVFLVDNIPTTLKLNSITPRDAASDDAPSWVGCVISDRLPNGYGGKITCELDRALGYGQETPEVVLSVTVDPTIPAGMIVNTAKVTATDKSLGDLSTLSLNDSAMVMTAGMLAMTGLSVLVSIQLALLLLVLGLGLVLFVRLRARRQNV